MDMPHTVDVMTATIPETHRLTGQMIIAGTPVRGTGTQIHAFDPAAGRAPQPAAMAGPGIDQEQPVVDQQDAAGGKAGAGHGADGAGVQRARDILKQPVL